MAKRDVAGEEHVNAAKVKLLQSLTALIEDVRKGLQEAIERERNRP